MHLVFTWKNESSSKIFWTHDIFHYTMAVLDALDVTNLGSEIYIQCIKKCIKQTCEAIINVYFTLRDDDTEILIVFTRILLNE